MNGEMLEQAGAVNDRTQQLVFKAKPMRSSFSEERGLDLYQKEKYFENGFKLNC